MNLEIAEVMDDKSKGKVLKLSGELDVYTAPKLKEVLMPLVQQEHQEIIVDLANVQYMDSTGLGVFIGALKRSQKYDSKLKLVNPQKRIHRLFSITGLAEVMDIRQEEEAR
jgi:anti-sigma B factor antagonist